MIEQTHKTTHINGGLLRPPAYPFSARDLFGNLRARLAAEHQETMGFERLGRLVGKSKSMAHHWFDTYDHPQVLAFMCLLERLSPAQRNAFIEAHCRPVPSLEDPCLTHAPAKVGKLWELLGQGNGLTVVTGGTDAARTFLATALGHASRRAAGRREDPLGIDLHRPTEFVPVESLTYIDPAAGIKQIKCATMKLLPRMLTSSGKLLIFNSIWTAVPEARDGILRCSRRHHVLLVEAGTPDLALLKNVVSTPLHVVTVFVAKRVSGGLRINCQRVKTRKPQQNRSFL